MPIRVEWANPEKTILLEIVEGEWTLKDAYNLLDEVYHRMAEVPHRVDIIADMTQSHFSRQNIFSTFNHLQRRSSPNAGIIVVVRANAYVKSIADLARKIAPRGLAKIQFVDTMEEAYAVIANQNA